MPTGELVTTTFTLRLSPAANESAALGTTCAYLGPGSIQSAQQLGGVTAYLKNFFDLYRWENTESGGTWRAHYTTETDEWWDRTGTSWSVGQNSTTWTFNAWNCQNIWDPRQTNGGFTPAWQDATRSYLYVYNFFIPWGWPTLSHPPGVGMMRTAEASPILLNGQNYGTINLVIDYPVYL